VTASSVTAPRIPSIGLTPEQLEARKRGIGGSDASAVIGCNPYRTAGEVYELKLGLREPDLPNAAMKRGVYLEPIARRLYRELTGRRIGRLPQVEHPSYPFMLCNVDGSIHANRRRNGHEGAGVLELKCPGVWSFAKIKREGLPLNYIAQMQHNLSVTGFSWGSFALFNADLWELIHFDVVADLELQHALIIKEQQFWLQHVMKQIPPPTAQDTTPELMAQLAKAHEDAGAGELIVRNDSEWAEAAAQFFEAEEIAETGENLKETAKDKLKKLMGQKGAVEGAGLRCYWNDQKGKRSFERKALEKSAPLDRIAVAAKINARIMADDTKVAILGDLVECAVDFTKFEKVGNPFDVFRTYRVKAGVGD
jgi:putative phage-type endonuclease